MTRLSTVLPIVALLGACGQPPASNCQDACSTESSSESSSSESSGGETESGSESESGSETETGDPPGVCGDGVVDPGEACDDANADDSDGCTTTCELGPCAFEWHTRELVMTGSNFAYHLPLVIEDEDLVVAHQLGAGGQQTGLVRSHRADGVAYDSPELMFMDGPPEVHALIGAPDGDLLLARASVGDTVEVHRLSPDGAIEWTVQRTSLDIIPDLQLVSTGELLLVDTVDNGPMNVDVELAALDPETGSELWSHRFGGPTAGNGFSVDHAGALAVGPDDRVYVGMDQYDDWDTISPVVVAFSPDGDPTPLWSTKVVELPSSKFAIRDVAVGPGGGVAVSFQREGGTQKFYVGWLDGETGELLWVVERDDFGLPNQLSVIRGLTVTQDRVLATGTWKLSLDGTDVFQAYVLGLDFDGALACLGTLDDYEPDSGYSNLNFLPMDMHASDGDVYLSGYVYARSSGDVDLLLARIR